MRFRENVKYEAMDQEVAQLQRRIRFRTVSEQDRKRMLDIVEDLGYRQYLKRRTRAYTQQAQRYGQIVFDI